MRRTEIAGCVVFILLGIHVILEASALPYTSKFGPGPGFLPYWLGWGWIALALLHLCNILVQPRLYPGRHPFPTGKSALRVVAVYALVMAGVFLLGILGLLFAVGIMITAILRGVERTRWRSSLVAGVGVSATLYLLFAVVLGVPFPRGPLGI